MTEHQEIEFRSDMTVNLVQHGGSDASIISAMLASTQGIIPLDISDEAANFGRINWLMRNRHGSPFEHAFMTFAVEAPIFVAREWFRHRVGHSYNEWSGRYSIMKPVFYVPPSDRNLVQVGKQGAYEYVRGDEVQWRDTIATIATVCRNAWNEYQYLLSVGVAREVARMVLPVNIYTYWYVSMNPRSAMHFLSLRTKDDTAMFPSKPMEEIDKAAQKLELEFAEKFPLTHRAFVENGRVAP